MAIAYVQTKASGSGADSQTLAFDSNVGAGNLLIASIRESGGTGGVWASVTDSLGNTWNQGVRGASGSGTVQMFWTKSVSAGACTVTFDGGSNVALRCTLHEFSGTFGATPIDQTAANTGDGTSPDASSSITPANANALLFSVCGSSADFTASSAGASWTLGPNGFLRVYGAYRIVSASASYNADWSYTSGTDIALLIASFVESGGGGGSVASISSGYHNRGLR
jgi:hypothetical protein